MSDYIKREDAINKFEDNLIGVCKEVVLKAINLIPSADVVDKELYDRAVSRVVELQIANEDLNENYDVAQHYALERKEELERKRGEWIRGVDNER